MYTLRRAGLRAVQPAATEPGLWRLTHKARAGSSPVLATRWGLGGGEGDGIARPEADAFGPNGHRQLTGLDVGVLLAVMGLRPLSGVGLGPWCIRREKKVSVGIIGLGEPLEGNAGRELETPPGP